MVNDQSGFFDLTYCTRYGKNRIIALFFFYLQGQCHVTLICRPELVIKPTMKAENIKQFGDILGVILDSYEEALTETNSPQQ